MMSSGAPKSPLAHLRLSKQLLVALLFLAACSPLFFSYQAYTEESLPVFRTVRAVGFGNAFMEVKRDNQGRPLPPYYGSWAPMRDDQVPVALKAAGFDSVRLAISPSPLLVLGEQDRQDLYPQFATAIDELLKAGLNVVVDLHVTDAGPPWDHKSITSDIDGPRFKAYVEVVSSVARFLSRYDARRVALEPFNEPPPPCIWQDRPSWPVFQKKLFQVARAAAPSLTLVLTGACGGGVEGLQTLTPTDYDQNTIFTFHFYDPFIFTHQGAWFTSPFVRYVSRLPYPPIGDRTDELLALVKERVAKDDKLNLLARLHIVSEAKLYLKRYFDQKQGGRAYMKDRLLAAAAWANTHGISPQRIWVGEFGAMRDAYGFQSADPGDRQRWLSDARSVFEEFGFGWATWGYDGAMGITINDTRGPLDPDTLRALGLKAAGSSEGQPHGQRSPK